MREGPDDRSPLVGVCGITRYIKEELIADGHGRASVPRPGGQRNGLKVGQRVDHDLCQYVQARRPVRQPGAVAVLAALRARALVPVAAQVRATNRALQLTTLVDLVCLRRTDQSVWAIEVKNTTLPRPQHVTSYAQQCRRTPTMRNMLRHTEMATHQLQAAFGAMAMMQSYSALPNVRALVVVATGGNTEGAPAAVYEVPANLYRWGLFVRHRPVPLAIKRATSTKTKAAAAKQRPSIAMRWPDGAEGERLVSALAQLGLKRKGRTSKKDQAVFPLHRPRACKTARAVGPTVAVIICLPTRFDRMSKVMQQKAIRLLAAAHAREVARAPGGKGTASIGKLWVARDTAMVSRSGVGA